MWALLSIAEQFLQCFSLPVPPCSRNSVCQADGRGEGAVTERPVKCKQSQGHVTGSKVTGSTWIMFNLLWFHCKINSLLTFLGHLSMLSTKTCHREGIQRLSVNAPIQPLGRSETDWTGIGGQGLRGVSSGFEQYYLRWHFQEVSSEIKLTVIDGLWILRLSNCI